MKKEIRAENAPRPGGPYAQGIKAGGRIYVSGQRPARPSDNSIPPDFPSQVRQCLDNVRAVLEAGGASLEDVVQVGVFLTDLDNFSAFNDIYSSYFKPPHPARTTVGCALRGIMVEINAVAEL
ncbi:MAG: Rid family detoxifying hydrolase [Desulfovibrio sp.]|jgi:2-iminobutanoate/2-iminopropanoate deaminase|nr:Rid family detoxifying hydrolase [Desulfovibrio sp.]